MKQFDQAASRGHGNAGLAAEDKSLLTGLANFCASVSQAVKFSNPMRSAEKDGFNYEVYQIEDTASSDAQVAYKDGKMVKASLRQEGRQSEHVMKYFLGKLESDKTTPGNYCVLCDLLPVLGPYKTGETDLIPEARLEQRKQALLTLSDDVLLKSYAGQTISLWQADVLPAQGEPAV